jgi:predicted DNA-binding transcriptional regulator AlpA
MMRTGILNRYFVKKGHINMQYLRIKDMLEKLKCSRATLYRRVDGEVPEPFHLGRTPMWIEEDIDFAMFALKHQGNPPTTA